MKKVTQREIWKKILISDNKEGSIRLKDLALEMQLAPQEALKFLNEMFPSGTGVDILDENAEQWVHIKSEALQFMLPLAPEEWILLEKILDKHKNDKFLNSFNIRKKFKNNIPMKLMMEILNHLEKLNKTLSLKQQKIVSILERAIQDKFLVNLTTKDRKKFLLHPCRVLHLEENLTLIAEDYQDHCLILVPISDVDDCEQAASSSRPKVTPYEVEEFITAIRVMNEKQMRLILKIYDPGPLNLVPDYHFLGRPYMISNSKGDLIWAAYVEPCDSLFEWLVSLGKKVEILDPITFREEYLRYCEEKIRKIA